MCWLSFTFLAVALERVCLAPGSAEIPGGVANAGPLS
jgi:hypothetical protein